VKNILIIYRCRQYPLRSSIRDHLYSFKRYSGARCFYFNASVRRVPHWLLTIPFDLIVFHTTFLSGRWSPRLFAKLTDKIRKIKDLPAVKVALPQDEYVYTDLLSDFITEFGVDYVFSVAPETEWPKVYRSVDFDKVKIFRVLTGYLEERTVKKINALAQRERVRPIDIGYRAKWPAPWLGWRGQLKGQIGAVFQQEAPRRGLVTDISCRREDTFLGDAWYRFLLRSKYTIGVEGGASILDKDGSIKEKTEEYLLRHPEATFEEIEAACFPDLDGSFNLVAISPRHLEACATKTCQVLIEGSYNGILRSGIHYIELRKDFSNIDQVLKAIKEDRLRARITERAYRDIVESRKYTYEEFAKFIVQTSLANLERGSVGFLKRLWVEVAAWYADIADKASWLYPVIYRLLIVRPYYALCRLLPGNTAAKLQLLRRRWRS